MLVNDHLFHLFGVIDDELLPDLIRDLAGLSQRPPGCLHCVHEALKVLPALLVADYL